MTVPPIDLVAAWESHKAEVLADREPRRISASDLHSCDTAFKSRYEGEQQFPYDNGSFSAFERGFSYEPRFFDAFSKEAEAQGLRLVWDQDAKIHAGGIEGHPDFKLYRGDELVAVIDPTTTASKFGNWSYGHALKSAWYADTLGCDLFAEVVVCIGFGGNILSLTPWWFGLDDVAVCADGEPMQDALAGMTWRERARLASAHVKALSKTSGPPAMPQPPIDPLDGKPESWRCAKYCRTATCHLNKKLAPMGRAS